MGNVRNTSYSKKNYNKDLKVGAANSSPSRTVPLMMQYDWLAKFIPSCNAFTAIRDIVAHSPKTSLMIDALVLVIDEQQKNQPD